MSRSVWKGPYVDPNLIKKVEKLKQQTNKTPIKTWARKSTIIPEFVGCSFLIHNGKKFIPIKISEEMVGHKLGEFSPTRQFSGQRLLIKKRQQKVRQRERHQKQHQAQHQKQHQAQLQKPRHQKEKMMQKY